MILMSIDQKYFSGRIGRADELTGRNYRIYRIFEIIPGALTWITILGSIFASYKFPLYAALFIIAFDVYWFIKTAFLSVHLRQNWRRVRHALKTDWTAMLDTVKHDHIYNMVVLPFYKEDYSIIAKGLDSLLEAKTDHSRMIIVLAAEERAGDDAKAKIERARLEYGTKFRYFFASIHPANRPGEMAGKGSNISYACEEARTKVLDANKISYSNVIVSAFDIDTVVYPDYFSCLTWNVLHHPRPLHASFQPVPLYNNNIWDVPALSRVVAFSGTFWQMIQQERPERLATFSSHAVLFETLYKVGYWQTNMVSEDSRIFWNCFVAFDGDYEVVPISYPVSMDANLAGSFTHTLKNIYLQQRRWSWGVENVAYICYNFLWNKNIRFRRKLRMLFVQFEGFWSLSTNPLLIFLLGWLPVIIGKGSFRAMVLAYNLPFITRNIMIITMCGLVLSSYMTYTLLPPAPKGTKWWKKTWFLLQWILAPVTITIFGAIPAVDSQTRLMLGKYMGFWVTPKHR
jgi:hypothetical protein